MINIQEIKNKLGIIGNSQNLNRSIEIAAQVAPTDLSVLITGESGSGKEFFPQIIHQLSHRKHGKYIAVNCGAIPEGTIDSELFGHEKGAFTGAINDRKGYFEVANGGTIFLDEVGELPLSTQVRLLRVLEAGEFIRVGSSKVQKTDVRVVAATNVNLPKAVEKGNFREDFYYRLNTVPITIDPLRMRGNDILLLFRRFALDFAEKYHMPAIRLSSDAQAAVLKSRWPGNIRQLKNVTEQISIIETEREIDYITVRKYLPKEQTRALMTIEDSSNDDGFGKEREMIYKVIFDMKKEISNLSKLVMELIEEGKDSLSKEENAQIVRQLYQEVNDEFIPAEKEDIPPSLLPMPKEIAIEPPTAESNNRKAEPHPYIQYTEEIDEEESLLLEEKEKELIVKALKKHKGRRKLAATDLGISERTLYRKLKEYDIKS